MRPMIPPRLIAMPASTITSRTVLDDDSPTLPAATRNPTNVTTIPTKAIIPPSELSDARTGSHLQRESVLNLLRVPTAAQIAKRTPVQPPAQDRQSIVFC